MTTPAHKTGAETLHLHGYVYMINWSVGHRFVEFVVELNGKKHIGGVIHYRGDSEWNAVTHKAKDMTRTAPHFTFNDHATLNNISTIMRCCWAITQRELPTFKEREVPT